jgi:hypothetical protein
MHARRMTEVLAVTLLVTGCERGTPISPTGVNTAVLSPNSTNTAATAEHRRCYSVSGELHEEGSYFDPTLSGTVQGGLEASSTVQIFGFRRTGNPSPAGNFAGHNTGVRSWVITGGTVPELIGRTLNLSFTAIANNPEPGFDLANGRWHETARITGGAESGNVHLHGLLDGAGFPLFVFDLQYYGEICP